MNKNLDFYLPCKFTIRLPLAGLLELKRASVKTGPEVEIRRRGEVLINLVTNRLVVQ